MSNEYPYIGELEEYGYPEACGFSEQDVQALKRIGSGEEEITSVVVGDNWIDDHEICVNVTVNGVKFSACWIVPEFFADVIYAGKGVESARERLLGYISGFTEDM